MWKSASTVADNGGTIIAPRLAVRGDGSGFCRWLTTSTPEMFGAKANGSFDDASPIRSAMSYLNSISGGTLTLGCNVTYNLASVGLNNAVINNYSNISIFGCGSIPVLRLAAGLNTSSASFVFGIWPVSNLSGAAVSNARYSAFTFDMNGQNNDCSGTCYAYNVAIGAEYGEGDTVDHVKVLNNAGSQGIAFGANASFPTMDNISITSNFLITACDAFNAACTDHSAIWVKTENGTLREHDSECWGCLWHRRRVSRLQRYLQQYTVWDANVGIIAAADVFRREQAITAMASWLRRIPSRT